MSKSRKAKNAKLPMDRLAAKAKNAAGAAATAGRSRVFADKGDKLAKNKGDAEIEEGVADYESKRIKQRLEYLRGELRAERISWGELHELQSLAKHIDSGDVELLEAAGVPEKTQKVVIEITLDASKVPDSVADSVRHWIENDVGDWPDYFYSVNVKDEDSK